MPTLDRVTRLLISLLVIVLLMLCGTLFIGIQTSKPSTPSITSTYSTSTILLPPATNTPLLPLTTTPTPSLLPSLRKLAEPQGMLIGASVHPGWFNDPIYADLLRREFNIITPENSMKWEVIHPELGRYDFTQADQVVDFARQNGMKVRGHTLVWTLQLPDWINLGNFTRQQWIDILRDHIHTVVSRYRTTSEERTVIAWDVVNESFKSDGSYIENIWYNNLGPEYIPLAFQFAHEADPDALLFYNDFNAEGLNQKSQAIYNLVKGLKQAGVPINGVGMQMHVTLDGQPSAAELAANLRRLADLGLIVHITEMDVRIQESQQSLPEKLMAQAEIYRQIFSTCLQSPNCQALITWGLTDRQSWIPGWTGQPDAPLLFDEAGRPKPAYLALLETLQSLYKDY